MEQIKAMQVIRRKTFMGPILLTGLTLALAAARPAQYRSTVMEVAPSRGATERGFHAEGRGGGGKPQPESGCQTASYKPPSTTGSMVTGSASVIGKRWLPAICP
jgi:hypothetical protein